MAVLPELFQLLDELGTIVGIVNGIQNQGAQESTSQLILSAVNGDIALTRIVLQTVVANQVLLGALAERVAGTQSNLLGAIGTPQQANQPVTLPATPPAGYGGASVSGIWAAVDPSTALSYGELLSQAGNLAYEQLALNVGLVPSSSPYFAVASKRAFSGLSYNPTVPFFDPGLLLASDTITSALNRLNPGVSFTNLDGSDYGFAGAFVVDGTGTTFVVTTFSGADLERMKTEAGIVPAPVATVPPVWPGSGGVTLGTAVPFSGSGFDVAGPMDGLIVDITSVPTPLPYYVYGSQTQYGKLGGVAFATDNGQLENQELLGFLHAIYTPRTMSHAQNAYIRSLSGIVGSVTPWSIA